MAVNALGHACVRCGGAVADTLQGLCPRCLLQLALERSSAHEPGDGIASTIGPYHLIRTLGEGGMGVVYFAEQREPLRRPVAFKIIKPGMDSRAVLARFAAESQALAVMSHPSIAQVYAAGLTDDGRPYFAMEYVPGSSIIEYCDSAQLSTAERLDLFVKVCGAVHHAHERGIVHRDIKPSNVLITMIDGRPVPKVIDFGVAKAMTRLAEGHTLVTEHGTLLGTPEYMSPEQIASGGVDVDRRSDVYSLGVLLYELLTGTLPFDASTFRVGDDQRIRAVRDEDAPRPSRRLAHLGAAVGEIAARRSTTPSGLKHDLGDLDWVVLKALERDRARRYQSVEELQADVCRAGQHEPVSARAPTPAYRARKYLRRHRVALAAIAVAIGSIAVGFAARTLVLPSRPTSALTEEPPATDLQVLTHTGLSWYPVVSPDGLKVAFVQIDRGRASVLPQSLWLADVTHGSIAPLPTRHASYYLPIHWSRDSRYLYYVEQAVRPGSRQLQRFSLADSQIETLQASRNMPEWLTLSPDERRVAGVRTDKTRGLSLLVVMNVDGSGEEIVATRSVDDPYFLPAWSPNGRLIACSVGNLGLIGRPMHVTTIDVDNRRERLLTQQLWFWAAGKVWLPDGRALLLLGRRWGEQTDALWRLDAASGEVRLVPTGPDWLSTWRLSATRDGATVAATRSAFSATMWLVQAARARESTEVGVARGVPRFLPDGRIMFTGPNRATWHKHPEGFEKRLVDGENAATTADGSFLVFTRERHAVRQVWRSRGDGGEPVQITHGAATNDLVDVSANGQWVVFVTAHDGALWKIPLAGGTPIRIDDGTARAPAISPDGEWVAAAVRTDPRAPWKPVIFSMSGRVPPREIPAVSNAEVVALRFSRDGTAIDVAAHPNGVGNVWRLPLHGGPPVQLTYFAADHLVSFDWSWDGKSLVCLRGGWQGDVVLLRGDW